MVCREDSALAEMRPPMPTPPYNAGPTDVYVSFQGPSASASAGPPIPPRGGDRFAEWGIIQTCGMVESITMVLFSVHVVVALRLSSMR